MNHKDKIKIYKLNLFVWDELKEFIEFHSAYPNVGVFDSTSTLLKKAINSIEKTEKLSIESVSYSKTSLPSKERVVALNAEYGEVRSASSWLNHFRQKYLNKLNPNKESFLSFASVLISLEMDVTLLLKENQI